MRQRALLGVVYFEDITDNPDAKIAFFVTTMIGWWGIPIRGSVWGISDWRIVLKNLSGERWRDATLSPFQTCLLVNGNPLGMYFISLYGKLMENRHFLWVNPRTALRHHPKKVALPILHRVSAEARGVEPGVFLVIFLRRFQEDPAGSIWMWSLDHWRWIDLVNICGESRWKHTPL